MMKLNLECENAVYGDKMRIYCKVSDNLCAHQRFKPCKGWSVLTNWKTCTGRDEHGKTEETAPSGDN